MPNKRPAKSLANNGNGRSVFNKILLSLPSKACSSLIERIEFVSTPTHTVLIEADEPIKFGYFVNEGLSSILNVLQDGKSVEVGLTGREGFIGLPLLVGFKSSPSRVIMQIGGSVFRIPAKDLAIAVAECPHLLRELNRFGQELALQSQQIATCNRLHPVEERLARWLLMCQDRVGGDAFALTQEFLSNMLATRRASVTIAAGILQKAGLITYKRGIVKIESRLKLAQTSCECYGFLVRQTDRWRRELSR